MVLMTITITMRILIRMVRVMVTPHRHMSSIPFVV